MQKCRTPVDDEAKKFDLTTVPCPCCDEGLSGEKELEPDQYLCNVTESATWNILFLRKFQDPTTLGLTAGNWFASLVSSVLVQPETSLDWPPLTGESRQKLVQLYTEVMQDDAHMDAMPGAWDLRNLLKMFPKYPPSTYKAACPPPPSPYYEAIRLEVRNKKEAIVAIHEAMNTFESVNEVDRIKRNVR
jgi:hypothetical protein